MKLLARMTAVVGIAAFSWEAQAADWFNIYSQEMKTLDTLIWAAADQTAESPVEDVPRNSMLSGNDYWIVTGFKVAGKTASGTLKNKVGGEWKLPSGSTLNIGSPSTSRFGQSAGSCRFMAGDNHSVNGTIRWYNGTFDNSQTYKSARYLTLSGSLAVEQMDATSTHVLQQKTAALTPIKVPAKISGMSPDAVISCASSAASTMESLLAAAGYYEFTGDNGSYNGLFALNSAYHPVILGGTQTLGNPEVPNPAALTICDNGAFAVGSSSASPTRGIRLDGETAYLAAWADSCSGFALGYPVSRNAGVAGKLVKVGAGSVTLDASYTAGDIEVSAGTLVIGANATLPAGQKIVVKDGATLKCVYNPNIDYTQVTITAEGSGAVTYDDGYRLNNGVWEVSVTMTVEGDGTVDATAWELPGTTVTRTATADADAFVGWKGDLAALVDRDPFATTVRVRVEKPLALTAVFGTLDKPEDVTCPDGTTFAFADNVMTITVPNGITNAYDYAALLSSGYVRQVVKDGTGALQLAAAPDYVGDFTILAGHVILSADGALGAPDVGTVDIRSGAAVWVGTSAVVASGKFVKLAGEGLEAGTAGWGVLRGLIAMAHGIQGTFDLTDSATVVAEISARFFTGSTVRMNGHVLTVRTLTRYQTIDIRDAVLSNDSDATAQLNFAGLSTKFYTAECRFEGLGEITVGNDCRCHIVGGSESSWPIVADYQVSMASDKNQEPAQTTMKWTGGVKIPDGNALKVGSSGVVKDSVVGIDGPISGLGTLSLEGGWLHWYSSENSFSGNFSAKNDPNNTLRTTLYLHDGSVFRCKNVLQFSNADLRLADATAFDLQAIRSMANDMSIVGGATGDSSCGRPTIAAIDFVATDDGQGTLFIDSPVAVTGRTHIARGTFRLGSSTVPYLPYASEQLPVLSDLAFEDGTAFDLNGNDLELADLSGFPTVQNAGVLALTGNLKLTADDVTAGRSWDFGEASFTFASGAKIVIDDSLGKPNRKARYTVLTAAGGISGVPMVQNVVRSSNWIAEIDSTGTKLDLVYQPKGLIISVR